MGAVVELAARKEAARLEVRGEGTRTLNMSSMVVTPTVLKSSGWLNSDASCRVAREVVRSGVRCGPGGKRAVGAVVAQAARREAARLEVRAEGTHQKHVFHGCDAGRVEVQRLVELLRVLPSCKVIRSRVGYWPGGERAMGAVVELAARREAARLEVGLRAHAP